MAEGANRGYRRTATDATATGGANRKRHLRIADQQHCGYKIAHTRIGYGWIDRGTNWSDFYMMHGKIFRDPLWGGCRGWVWCVGDIDTLPKRHDMDALVRCVAESRQDTLLVAMAPTTITGVRFARMVQLAGRGVARWTCRIAQSVQQAQELVQK